MVSRIALLFAAMAVGTVLQSCQDQKQEPARQATVERSSEGEATPTPAPPPPPRTIERETEWSVTWNTLTGDMKRGGEVGTGTFPSTFSYNWGDGVVYGNYNDFIAFTATAEIFVPRSGMFEFTIGSDDGMKLSVDDNLILDCQWSGGGSYASKSTQVQLSKGKHQVRLVYYDRGGGAAASFDCDHELLTWTENVQ